MTLATIANYKLIKQIGQGGFARTYLAKHLLLGEMACIKQNLELSPEDEKLLLKEAKLLWQIHHYSLPTLRDFVKCDDDSYALIMTYVEGKELFKIINEDYPRGLNSKDDVEHVCWMTQRLLNALHYLHFHGVVHGDVKPQNILIKPNEHNAILVDYGLSTLNPGRHSSSPGYTPAFAAPEQLAGKPPVPETDLYGLGLTMVFAMGGNYQAKTFPSNIPKELQAFFSKMILHDPMKRPKTAQELIRPLSDLREKIFGRRNSNKAFIIS